VYVVNVFMNMHEAHLCCRSGESPRKRKKSRKHKGKKRYDRLPCSCACWVFSSLSHYGPPSMLAHNPKS